MHELDNPELLAKVMAGLADELGVASVKRVGVGNEFYIFRADLPDGPVVVKVPKDKVFSNVNDARVDSKVLLEQEYALMRHVRANGLLQVPEPVGDFEVEGYGALVMSYVGSDDSKPEEWKLGNLLATIHGLPLPDFPLSAQEGSEMPELIADRLSRRWKELTALVTDLPSMVSREILAASLAAVRPIKCLLHMDFRQANFRMQNGEVVAVLDWSNSLIGHPALELARVAETGETGEEFLRGYTAFRGLPMVPALMEVIFRLDTATMLALVFLSEDPDPVRGPAAADRVRELHAQLLIELR